MTDTLAIVDIVLPVFLVIGLGCVLRASGLIDEAINAFLSKLVFYVAAPALLFRSTALAPLRETVDLPALLVIAGVTVFVTVAVYIGSARSAPARQRTRTSRREARSSPPS